MRRYILILNCFVFVPAMLLPSEHKETPILEGGGSIRVGAYSAFSMRTKLRLDSTELPIGIYLDEDKLGFEHFTGEPRSAFTYRFARRHAIDAEYILQRQEEWNGFARKQGYLGR